MNNRSLMSDSFNEYSKEDVHSFYVNSSLIEALGYCEWVRLREIMEFSRSMGYHHLGLAFCKGLKREANITSKILKENGFEVSSVICKTGGFDKCSAGVDIKVHPDSFEPMCNPIAQARFLKEAGSELNIVLGLCVGHDSLFYQYSHVKVTTFVVKDRVLAHNPAAALYLENSYMKKRVKG